MISPSNVKACYPKTLCEFINLLSRIKPFATSIFILQDLDGRYRIDFESIGRFLDKIREEVEPLGITMTFEEVRKAHHVDYGEVVFYDVHLDVTHLINKILRELPEGGEITFLARKREVKEIGKYVKGIINKKNVWTEEELEELVKKLQKEFPNVLFILKCTSWTDERDPYLHHQRGVIFIISKFKPKYLFEFMRRKMERISAFELEFMMEENPLIPYYMVYVMMPDFYF